MKPGLAICHWLEALQANKQYAETYITGIAIFKMLWPMASKANHVAAFELVSEKSIM